MRFLAPIFAVLAALAAAQNPNSFNINGNVLDNISAGGSVDLTWSNPTGSTVTINLRQGPSNDLGPPVVSASSIQNSGSYTWRVPNTIVAGSGYALEIIDDDDTNLINYTPPFSIASSVTASASASTASATASSTSSSSSSAAASTTTGSSSSSSSSSAAATTTNSGSSTMSTSTTTTSAKTSSSSAPANNPAPILHAGGPLLAVALGVAVVL